MEKPKSDYARQTKIICTLGSASSSVETLVEMLDAGMNVARLDFSDGNQFEKSLKLKNLKEAMIQRPHTRCAILLDLKGPEIRTNIFVEDLHYIKVKMGQSLTIVADPDHLTTENSIGCSYTSLPTSARIGSKICIDDEGLTCEVKKIEKDRVVVECINDYTMRYRSPKSMSLPGSSVDLPLTDKDTEDIQKFAVKHEVDYIAASFVRSDKDLKAIRKVLGPEGSGIRIISKI